MQDAPERKNDSATRTGITTKSVPSRSSKVPTDPTKFKTWADAFQSTTEFAEAPIGHPVTEQVA